MTELNWNREALNNGDGPATVVAYDENGNELFWVKEMGEHNQWQSYVSYGPERGVLASQKIVLIENQQKRFVRIFMN